MCAVLFLVGVAVALIPNGDRDHIRKAMTLLGSVTGLAAALWLVPAMVTAVEQRAEGASVGGWLLIFIVRLGYGGVTRWLTPVGRDEQRQDAM